MASAPPAGGREPPRSAEPAEGTRVMPEDHKFDTIIVEGTPHRWPSGENITYVQVVTLEVPDFAQHPTTTYAVKYTKGPRNRPDGILAPGASIKVRDGMRFSVSETGQS